MKKQVVKLDQKALRGLIKEAIQGRQPGSPLFTPPQEKRQSRAQGTYGPAKQISDIFYEEMMKMYDSGDPSMELAGGRDAWEHQVAKATEEFEIRAQELLEELESKLNNGEYYSG